MYAGGNEFLRKSFVWLKITKKNEKSFLNKVY